VAPGELDPTPRRDTLHRTLGAGKRSVKFTGHKSNKKTVEFRIVRR
jgi:hypothetical protein